VSSEIPENRLGKQELRKLFYLNSCFLGFLRNDLDSAMLSNYDDFLIERFEQPDEVRTFEKGKFEIVKVGSMKIGRASYEPGWKLTAGLGRFADPELFSCLPSRACMACTLHTLTVSELCIDAL
jgi:hypothetical protein